MSLEVTINHDGKTNVVSVVSQSAGNDAVQIAVASRGGTAVVQTGDEVVISDSSTYSNQPKIYENDSKPTTYVLHLEEDSFVKVTIDGTGVENIARKVFESYTCLPIPEDEVADVTLKQGDRLRLEGKGRVKLIGYHGPSNGLDEALKHCIEMPEEMKLYDTKVKELSKLFVIRY